MTILGATTEELVSLAGQLGTTTTDIGGVQRDTQTIAADVTREMHDSFTRAMGAISTAMTAMNTSVGATRSQLEGTTWTGTNRGTFDGAYTDFNAAMTTLEGAINDAYHEFNAQLELINGLITDFQVQVSASLDDAQASTTSMQAAVDAQRDNLETVMNTGLTVG